MNYASQHIYKYVLVNIVLFTRRIHSPRHLYRYFTCCMRFAFVGIFSFFFFAPCVRVSVYVFFVHTASASAYCFFVHILFLLLLKTIQCSHRICFSVLYAHRHRILNVFLVYTHCCQISKKGNESSTFVLSKFVCFDTFTMHPYTRLQKCSVSGRCSVATCVGKLHASHKLHTTDT